MTDQTIVIIRKGVAINEVPESIKFLHLDFLDYNGIVTDLLITQARTAAEHLLELREWAILHDVAGWLDEMTKPDENGKVNITMVSTLNDDPADPDAGEKSFAATDETGTAITEQPPALPQRGRRPQLTDAQVLKVRKLINKGERVLDIAEQVGISTALIYRIKSGQSYADVT